MVERQKILIVEDSASQAAIIAQLVEQLGFQVAIYTAVPSGISQILEKERPELVLLDLMLLDERGKQVADGFQICREIKRWSSELPVVVITAEEDDDANEWAILQGADAYMNKPFAPDDLLSIIKEFLPV